MILQRPPRGAALYKLVEIKPADDPNLVPYEDLGALLFWYDPDPGGLSSGIKQVYPQPSPVSVGEVIAALIQETEFPAPEVDGMALGDRLNLIHRTENQRADVLIRAHRGDARKGEDAVKARGLLTEAQRASLLHGDLSTIGRILHATWVLNDPAEISGQDHSADIE